MRVEKSERNSLICSRCLKNHFGATGWSKGVQQSAMRDKNAASPRFFLQLNRFTAPNGAAYRGM